MMLLFRRLICCVSIVVFHGKVLGGQEFDERGSFDASLGIVPQHRGGGEHLTEARLGRVLRGVDVFGSVGGGGGGGSAGRGGWGWESDRRWRGAAADGALNSGIDVVRLAHGNALASRCDSSFEVVIRSPSREGGRVRPLAAAGAG